MSEREMGTNKTPNDPVSTHLVRLVLETAVDSSSMAVQRSGRMLCQTWQAKAGPVAYCSVAEVDSTLHLFASHPMCACEATNNECCVLDVECA